MTASNGLGTWRADYMVGVRQRALAYLNARDDINDLRLAIGALE